MKTWRQLEAMAKRQGIDEIYVPDDGHKALLVRGGLEVGRVEWWCDDRKTRDRILRAMVEAALEVGR